MSPTSRTPDYLKLAVFIGSIMLIGFAIGMSSNPKATYANLIKPPFAPPAWVFGPVWSALYIMIATAGWRLHERDPGGLDMGVWWAQMALNFLWTPVFFMVALKGIALAVILVLLALVTVLIARLWRRDRTAALLLVPYAVWVAFAALLNAEIVRLN